MSALLMFLLFLIIFKTGGHFASCRQTAQG